MYHKNKNTSENTTAGHVKPEKTILEKWGRRVPPTKQCYGAASRVFKTC